MWGPHSLYLLHYAVSFNSTHLSTYTKATIVAVRAIQIAPPLDVTSPVLSNALEISPGGKPAEAVFPVTFRCVG